MQSNPRELVRVSNPDYTDPPYRARGHKLGTNCGLTAVVFVPAPWNGERECVRILRAEDIETVIERG